MFMAWLFVLGLALAASIAPALVWHDKHPMPEGRSGGAAGAMAGKLVYAGGTTWRNGVKIWLNTAVIYDFKRNMWTSGPALPEPLAYGPYLADGESLEILGGANDKGSSRKCWQLKAGEHAWTQSGVLPADGILGKAASVGGRVYLFGGSATTDDLNHLSDAVYERSEAGEWRQVTKMPQGAIVLPAIARLGESVYLFGGCSAGASGAALNREDAYRFDGRANRWTTLHPLPAAVRGLSAVPLDDRYILLAGGYTDSGFSSAVYVYDSRDGQYRSDASLPLPVMGMELLRRGSALWGIGGEDKNRSRTARVLEGFVTRSE
jgi:N-acetylneuraminic acid mutarotase